MYKGNFASDMLFSCRFVTNYDICVHLWRKNIKQSDKVWPQKRGKNRENILMAS